VKQADAIEAMLREAGRPMPLMNIVAKIKQQEFGADSKAAALRHTELQESILRTLYGHPGRFRRADGQWYQWTLADAARGPQGESMP
jgi:hypothetical protein